MLKILRWLIVLIILSYAVFFAWCSYQIFAVSIVCRSPVRYIVEKGATIDQMAHFLHHHASLRYPFLFRVWGRLNGSDKRIQGGEYLFERGATISSVLNQVVKGDVLQHTFTLVPGSNIYDVRSKLANDPFIKQTLKGVSNAQLAKQLDISQDTPEGLLLPDTYYFTYQTTDLAILKRAKDAMNAFMSQVFPSRAQKLPYKNAYQALIVASLVEKESNVPSERPMVAAIILKRWEKWVPLQIDSSVIYGLLPQFDGNLTRKDLRRKTPYNTYTRYGLPSSPIAMPGRESILAALHPAQTDNLYFVARGDGTHVFSETLKAHDRAVRQFQLKK